MTINKRTTKFKPLYKKFLSLRENVQNRQKLLKFQKKKWKKFITFYKNKLKRYRKFKLQNQNIHVVSKRPDRYNAYTNRYKRGLKTTNQLRLFIGNIRKKSLSRLAKISQNNHYSNLNQLFLETLERRLDLILFRSKLCYSIRNAQQLVAHRKVSVNEKVIRTSSYLVKNNDIITINLQSRDLIESNIQKVSIWPLPPKYLTINYKTMQIIVGNIENMNTSVLFSFNLNLDKILGTHL